MAGVAKMRREAFIDLKQDNSRITHLESVGVVAIAGLSLGLGEALVFPLSTYLMIAQLVTSIALVLLVTASWSGLVYLIGTRIFKGSTDFPGMARHIFFSVTPGL